MEQEDFFKIAGYCDNGSEKWGCIFGGKPVIAPKELERQKDACVLICSAQPKVDDEIREQLNNLDGGIENYLIDEVIMKHHAEEILQVYESLGDFKSKEVYEELIRCRVCNEFPNEKMYSGEAYFSVDVFKRRNPKEVFIDAGVCWRYY